MVAQAEMAWVPAGGWRGFAAACGLGVVLRCGRRGGRVWAGCSWRRPSVGR